MAMSIPTPVPPMDSHLLPCRTLVTKEDKVQAEGSLIALTIPPTKVRNDKVRFGQVGKKP